MNKIACIAVGLCLLAYVGQAQAVPEIYVGTAGGDQYMYPGGGNVGTEFTVAATLTVLQLGVADVNGLSDSHELGLWELGTNGGSTLLETATVPANATAGAYGYAWVPAAPVVLTPGNFYVIGANYPTANDEFTDSAPVNSPFTMLTDLYTDGSFAMPATGPFGSPVDGWFGPNLQASATPPVPEPITFLTGLMVVSGIGAYVRRRTRIAKA